MEQYIAQFAEHLKTEKKMAENSFLAYTRDVREFCRFLEQDGIRKPEEVTNTSVISYLLQLKNEGRSSATINRKRASVRAFFEYSLGRGWCLENPTLNIKSPKTERRQLEYLTIEEVEKLLEQPDESAKGVRDQALLELMYAAGMRVSEVVGTDLEDLNLRIGFVTIRGEFGKPRIIPLGRPARASLENYVYEGRAKMPGVEKTESRALFVNYNGGRLTRQGIWKILRYYAGKAGLEHKITPQILRNSFAVHMVQNGADLKSLQELMGHEDLSATQIYLSVSKTRIKDVYDKTHPRA